MSILSKLFGGGKYEDPAAAAAPYLNQIPGVGHDYYDPYVSAGRGASDRLGGEYESLLNDPTALLNKLMEGYEPSKGYQFQKDLLTKELSNTAAAGGIAGTPLDQMNQGQAIQGILSKDMQQFLANALGLYGTGLQGEEGIAGRGFQASGSLADLLGGALNQQGGLAFQGAQQRNQLKSNDRNALIGMLAKALGGAAGFAAGGPLGALAGGGFGSSMYGGG